MILSARKNVFFTFSADSGPEVVAELEGILDGDALAVPHLLELGQAGPLAASHHIFQILKVPVKP